MSKKYIDEIRTQIIGNNLLFNTPFGKRHMLYADYTASGRGLKNIEEKMQKILFSYANTHTEDDYSGKYLTTLLHQAEERIKEIVNAGEHGKIIMTGSGATGALLKLQEIIGVYIPPVTKERVYRSIKESIDCKSDNIEKWENKKPVVFIGPYEHHTNELMWREAFVDVVVIPIDEKGEIDLTELEKKISNKKYKNRTKFASFSAGSNVTGIRTRVYDIARICHKNDTFVFFDFAAIAPYDIIDMNKDDESYFDAIFFSPHKFLGGPGTAGVLVFNDKLYRNDLPPTCAGGGTVVYVGFSGHDFSKDIETREKAGTPPILQAIKASLVLDLKEKIGVDVIADVENNYTKYFINELLKIENIELIGDIDSDKKVAIVSFNIKHRDRILHPKFVTKLMNDLFGIQSRAGCSCAGPYGHILLGINDEISQEFRKIICDGFEGIKPGWVRVNIHYTLHTNDIDYLLNCIKFIANNGYLFLSKYSFDMKTSEWNYIGYTEPVEQFSIDTDFTPETIDVSDIEKLRKSYFEKAEIIAKKLKENFNISFLKDSEEIEKLKNFYYVHKK